MTNLEKINEFLERGVERIYPSKEFLKSKLESGEKLTMYLGIDPTGPTLHLGHSVILEKLKMFQMLGHKVILLIGDFTGMIGDPTDKTSARKKLTRQEVLDNCKLYKKQAGKLLKFTGENPVKLVYNSRWLRKLKFDDVLELTSLVTVEQMLKRDMFQKRIEDGKPTYVSEFLYPLMQGYDSVALDVNGEIGGNDQTFNMLIGRDLMRQMLGKEKFVITMKLLQDEHGKKMGKTEGNMVPLDDKPEEMFGKIMSWSDGFILPSFELLTEVPPPEVDKVKSDLASGANPRDLKLKLAEAIVSIYHSASKAKKAKKDFLATFSKGQIPADIKEFKISSGALLSDCLASSGLIVSKSEWRRLVGEKAVSLVADNGTLTKILDFNFKVEEPAVFKIGKHRFLRIILN